MQSERKVLREYRPTKQQKADLYGEKRYSPVSYLDHYPDGRVAIGEEDFSLQRWGNVVSRYVYLPTGKRNKGGKMTWERERKIISRSARECGMIARAAFHGSEFSLRQY